MLSNGQQEDPGKLEDTSIVSHSSDAPGSKTHHLPDDRIRTEGSHQSTRYIYNEEVSLVTASLSPAAQSSGDTTSSQISVEKLSRSPHSSSPDFRSNTSLMLSHIHQMNVGQASIEVRDTRSDYNTSQLLRNPHTGPAIPKAYGESSTPYANISSSHNSTLATSYSSAAPVGAQSSNHSSNAHTVSAAPHTCTPLNHADSKDMKPFTASTRINHHTGNNDTISLSKGSSQGSNPHPMPPLTAEDISKAPATGIPSRKGPFSSSSSLLMISNRCHLDDPPEPMSLLNNNGNHQEAPAPPVSPKAAAPEDAQSLLSPTETLASVPTACPTSSSTDGHSHNFVTLAATLTSKWLPINEPEVTMGNFQDAQGVGTMETMATASDRLLAKIFPSYVEGDYQSHIAIPGTATGHSPAGVTSSARPEVAPHQGIVLNGHTMKPELPFISFNFSPTESPCESAEESTTGAKRKAPTAANASQPVDDLDAASNHASRESLSLKLRNKKMRPTDCLLFAATLLEHDNESATGDAGIQPKPRALPSVATGQPDSGSEGLLPPTAAKVPDPRTLASVAAQVPAFNHATSGKGCLTNPKDVDVLCGRGGLINKHPGNVVYRKVVDYNKPYYQSVHKKHRILVSQSIVQSILNYGGRFLIHGSKGGTWMEIGFKRAVQKTSQALRERVSAHDDDQQEEEDDDENSDTMNEDEDQDRNDESADGDSHEHYESEDDKSDHAHKTIEAI